MKKEAGSGHPEKAIVEDREKVYQTPHKGV
jgi:hypothetical protein